MTLRLFAIKLLKKLHLAKPVKKILDLAMRALGSKRQFLKGDGTASFPHSVGFELTTKCNLRCEMCYQRQERLLGKRDLSFDEIKKILDNIPNLKRASLIGAEIFMRPDIFQIIEEFINRGIKLYLTTNGTLINKDIVDKLKKFKKGIRGIGFSLDGLRETHNRIRGADFAFDRTIEAINLVKKDFNVSINSVMMKDNIDELYDLIKYLRSLGVVNFGLTLEMFATSEEIVSSKNLLGYQDLPLALEVQKEAKYKFSLEKLKSTIDRIRAIKGITLVIQPGVFDDFPEEFYNGTLRKKANLICKNMFLGRVNAQGDLIFCPFIKKPFGNLLEQSFEEIWNSEEFRKFRKNLMKNNLAPICSKCCRLGVKPIHGIAS